MVRKTIIALDVPSKNYPQLKNNRLSFHLEPSCPDGLETVFFATSLLTLIFCFLSQLLLASKVLRVDGENPSQCPGSSVTF